MPIHDVGRFVGRYFQILACLSMASMVIAPIFFDYWYFDFSFVLLLWAASHLIRHNPTARSITIWTCGLCVVAIVGILIYAGVLGADAITIRLGKPIENPSFFLIAVVAGIMLVAVGIPLALLLTPQARQEFA